MKVQENGEENRFVMIIAVLGFTFYLTRIFGKVEKPHPSNERRC